MFFYGVMTQFSFNKNWPSVTVVAKVTFTIFSTARLVSRDTPDILQYTASSKTGSGE